MCKILGFIKIKRKTKTDEQIDEIQESLAKALLLIADKIKRKTRRSLRVVDINGGKPELIKRDLIDINLYVDDIKNLASDLRADTRL